MRYDIFTSIVKQNKTYYQLFNNMEGLKKALKDTRKANIQFGRDCDYGYHTHYIDGQELKGQRDTNTRLTIFKKYVDFTDKCVIDFGCCTGAMLMYLPIKSGIGLDIDPKYISAANQIKNYFRKDHLSFTVFNLEKNLEKLGIQADISMCLSLGSWIKNWKQLYQYCYDNTDTLILETNNEQEGRVQIDFVRSIYQSVEKVCDQSLDDRTGNYRRQLWICKK